MITGTIGEKREREREKEPNMTVWNGTDQTPNNNKNSTLIDVSVRPLEKPKINERELWALILSIDWKLNENGHFKMLNVIKTLFNYSSSKSEKSVRTQSNFRPFSLRVLFYRGQKTFGPSNNAACDFYGQRTPVFISIRFLHILPKTDIFIIVYLHY